MKPKAEPDKVKVVGPAATHKGGILASIPTEFTIDASEAGIGTPDVQIIVSILLYFRVLIFRSFYYSLTW